MHVPGQFVKPLKIFGIVCGLLIFYSLAGFYLIPAVLKWKLPQIIEQQTGRKAKIARIHFNPFVLSASVQGFEFQERQGQPFVTFDDLDVDINALQSIKQMALVIDKIWLNKAYVHNARLRNGKFNFSDLIKNKEETQKQDSKLFPLVITKLSLTEGKLAWEDAQPATPVKEDVYPISLVIENFTTQADQQSRVGFSLALSSGGKLDWQGKFGINPLLSSGHLKLDAINLKKISELALQDKASFELQGSQMLEADYEVRYKNNSLELVISKSKTGLSKFQFTGKKQNKLSAQMPSVSLEGTYKVKYHDNTLQFNAENSKVEIHDIQLSGLNPDKVSIKIPAVTLESAYQADYAGNTLAFTTSQGQITVKGFELSEKEHNNVLVKIPALLVQGIGFNLNSQEVLVDSVTMSDANIKAALTPDGNINYQSLFSIPQDQLSPTDKPEVNQTEVTKAPWLVNVSHLALNNIGIEFEDQSPKKEPVLIDIRPLNLKLSQLTTKKGAKLPFQLNAGINKTGLIKLNGDTVIEPLQLQSAIDIKNIALDIFQPYVDQFAHLDVIDGELNVNGNATVGIDKNNKLDVKFKGDGGIENLITRDRKLNKDLVKWKKLTLKDMAIDLPANRYTASALIIDKPYARVTIRKDKTVNFSDIVIADNKTSKTPVKTVHKPRTDQPKPYFQLDKFQLIDGSSDFSDLSLILPFAAPISSLDGGARNLTSERESKIKIDLKGNAYDISPVDIKGEIRPYLGNYNVELNFQGMPMPLMSPYMAQFAGYKVEKGKLTLGLKYAVADKKLTASNSILIDQFELGEKVENPNAVSLPLELAVALLKDSNGRIKIDVPITGSLEDPKFSISSLIANALLNALSKVVTAPFNAIASLIGSQEDLSVVNFPAGASTLNLQQKSKLDGVARALKEKPVLNLEIKGAAFQEQDWPALQEDALRDQLKKLKAAEVSKEEGRKTRAEYVELSDKDYKRLLAQQFLEKFPMLAEKSFLGTPRLIDPKSGDFYEVAKQKLEAIIKPETHRLKELAAERAQAIAKYIVQKGGIPNERIFILDTALNPKRDNADIVSFLSLKTN